MARTVDPGRTAQRREAILLAAGRLFGERGYERTTVAQIAEAAGLSAASVFYYFADKPAVFRAVFERDLPLAEALVARHADDADPVAAILDVLSELAEDAADPAAAGMLVELLRRVEHDPDLLSVVTRTARVVRDGLAELIARGAEEGTVDPELDPAEAATWLQAVVDATYLNARPGHSPVPALRRTALGYLAPNQLGRTQDHE
ncbi:TetR/AcrR family transcriptional regulator [Marinitenerispora sediminis]|uniref:TetR/AcrR family transcriptional regulator n=1 Tax=Marinitenerispora sediminis TaxID=1931232 RepID=A0A368TAJ4_9ACTN|nr:TetR/AcrR family transcriptional regulator [Marinitenerispora sediminis]RCV55889.1 TetR/AcrR family transcriptional regulator [Marinitenerispora sediminis]RCV61989.1 TetR/AcrR family transcriptional regulator [Marinitenerispora sediminis]RCV62019.1 TetR/AcrR family transcriptional regulator [Marinitenerispora sediminis]